MRVYIRHAKCKEVFTNCLYLLFLLFGCAVELNNTTPIEPETPRTTDRPLSASSPATLDSSGRLDLSCFSNITVEYPDPSLCKGRADGRYQTTQEPPVSYTCALGKAYLTECPTVHSAGATASRDGLLLGLLFLTVFHQCCVCR